MKWILICGATVLAILAFMQSGSPAAVTMDGYYKSANRDRVVAYVATMSLTADETRAALERAPTTAGRTTIVVVYATGTPAPGGRLTNARDLADAARIVGTAPFDKWTARLRINAAGERTFD